MPQRLLGFGLRRLPNAPQEERVCARQERLVSSGQDGKTLRMQIRRGQADYRVSHRRAPFPDGGTQIAIWGILPGIRQFGGEKWQWYLASELRERIRGSGVEVRVIDRTARAEFKVEPRQFKGRLLRGPVPASRRSLPGARRGPPHPRG